MKLLKKIVKKHSAWTNEDGNKYDILQLFRKHEHASMVTCARRAARQLSELATTVLVKRRHKKPLATLPGDWQDEPENFDAEHEVPKRFEAQQRTRFKTLQGSANKMVLRCTVKVKQHDAIVGLGKLYAHAVFWM